MNWGNDRRREGDSPPNHGPADPPKGAIAVFLAIGLVVLAVAAMAGVWLVRNANRAVVATAGPWSLKETDRLATGQQRIDRVAFAPEGDRLAGTCPRYNRLVTYQVDRERKLRPIAETALEGRPVGIVALGSRFLVLQRPAGDQKHLEPGWWEAFDRDGKKVDGRQPAGFYPDDLAVSPDGRFLFILTSGRAEGDDKKPLPAVDIVAIGRDGSSPRAVGRLSLDLSDDPERLSVSVSGRYAAVFLARSKQTVALDLSQPEKPRLLGRTKTITADAPYVSTAADADWIMMPTAADDDTIAIELPGAAAQPAGDRALPRADYAISTRQDESALEIFQTAPRHSLGRFPLMGPFNLGRTRPTGLAYSAKRGLIAVATRTGTIHLVELRTRIADAVAPDGGTMATRPRDALQR